MKSERRAGRRGALEGEYPKSETTPRVIHYTNGGPWFEEWQDCDFAELWLQERDLYLASERVEGIRIKAYG